VSFAEPVEGELQDFGIKRVHAEYSLGEEVGTIRAGTIEILSVY
jgi:hypothetical protein